jgi:hypothetical protein
MINRPLMCPQLPAFQERGDPMDARHDLKSLIPTGYDIIGTMLVARLLRQLYLRQPSAWKTLSSDIAARTHLSASFEAAS